MDAADLPRPPGGDHPLRHHPGSAGALIVLAEPQQRAHPARMIPADLQDRRVEITGPTNAKMVINALNSGARVFMADFEDATSPTWDELVEGQVNLRNRWLGTLDFTDSGSGKHYALGPNPAVLIVRPRGWHLPERHVTVDGHPIAGALF